LNVSRSKITLGRTIVIAGQSNAVMKAYKLYSSNESTPTPVVNNINSSGWFSGKNDPYHHETAVGGYPTGSSYTQISDSYYAQTGVPLVWIPVAEGGTSVTEWQPGASAGYYSRMINTIDESLTTTENVDIYWHQGEADAGSLTISQYKSDLTNLKDNTFSQLDGDNKWYIGRIHVESKNNADTIIEAQSQAIDEDSDFYDGGNHSDITKNLHFGEKGTDSERDKEVDEVANLRTNAILNDFQNKTSDFNWKADPGNNPPVASFSVNDSSPNVNETVSFDATGSSDSDGLISKYEYDFDGDRNYEGSGNITSKKFKSSGEFNVKLRVTDNESAIDSVTQTISVSVNTSEEVFGINQDDSRSSDTDTQYLSRIKKITNLGSGLLSGFSVSDPSIPGTCSNCGKTIDLQGSESKNVTYNSSGDWISGETSYSLESASSAVEYGAFNTNYSAEQIIEVRNDRNDMDLSVKLDPAIPSNAQCVVESNTEVSIASGSTENNTISKSCNPGDENDYQLTKNIADNITTYEYNGTVEVYSDRTDEVEHEYWAKKSRFTDFSNKDASSVNYSIDGVTEGLDVSVKSRDGSDYLVWTAYTNRTNSSVHQGTHYFNYEYSVSDSSSDGGGSTGSTGSTGSSSDQTQITESPYDWGVTLVDSEFVGIFKPSVRPGQSFEKEIVVNSDERDLEIDVFCESDGSACEWVSPDISTVNFEDEGQTIVTIKGKVPEDAQRDTFRFNIAFTDPAYEEGSSVGKNTVKFVVSTESRWDFIFEYWNSLTGFYNGVPIAFFGFFMAMIFFVPAWALGNCFQLFDGWSDNYDV